MQLSKFVILNITALLFSTGEACKCYGTKGNLNNGATHKCCNITMVYTLVMTAKLVLSLSISVDLTGAARVKARTVTFPVVPLPWVRK